MPAGGPVDSFFMTPVDETEVGRVILSLKSDNVVDCYDISKVLQATVNVLALPLSILINKCISSGYFPNAFKLSRCLPFHKKGDASLMENYRSICIIPIFGKIFEVIIRDRLSEYVENQRLLSPCQFGFRSQRSTVMAVTEVVDFVVRSFDENVMCAAVLLDVQKAFDTLDHSLLSSKLERYGVRGLALRLISSFLVSRRQYVDLSSGVSKVLPVNYGVPQGSVLGPLMFLLFINDFPLHMSPYKVILYADDSTILLRGKNRSSLDADITNVLIMAKEWFTANKLAINTSKTEILYFSSAHNKRQAGRVNLLGVVLDGSLRWNFHVEMVAGRLSSSLYVLRRLRPLLADIDILNVYFSLIHAHMNYAILLWGASARSQELFTLQKSAIRIIGRLGNTDSCRAKFREYRILTLPSLYIYNCLMFIRSNIGSFARHCDVHSHDTRSSDMLLGQWSRIQITKSNKVLTELFNLLPVDVQRLEMKSFKRRVHAFLIEGAFYSISEFMEHVTSWR